MKTAHVIIFFLLSFKLQAKTFELIVNAPFNTDDSEEVYLTGDIPNLCNWEVKCLKLDKIFKHTFRKVITIKDSVTNIDFKITKGSWSKQATSSSGRLYPNNRIQLEIDKTIKIMNVANWSDKKAHGVTGDLITLKNFKASPLKGSKSIWIWLPPSYKNNPSKKYPVLYMHDGQNVFDPQTSGFGNEWSVDEVMDKLITQKKIREAIVVASSSSPDNRNGEYTYDRDGHQYANFIINSLKPYIDKNYRTLSNKENTYLMGSSMGALISFTILWKHNDVFSKAAALSLPPFAHDDRVFKWLKSIKAPNNKTSLYIDHGTTGQDKKYLEHVLRFINVLELKGYPKKSIEYQVAPYADHTELDWARRVEKPLLYLLSI